MRYHIPDFDPTFGHPENPRNCPHCGQMYSRRGTLATPAFILLLIPSLGSEPRASEPSSTKVRTAAQIRPVPAGRGRDSAHPAIGPHSGPQAVTRGFPVPAGDWLPAGARWTVPACPTAAGKTHPLPVGWAGSCRDYCRSTSCRCCRCSWCAPPR